MPQIKPSTHLVQQHGADQGQAAAHLDLGHLLGHALALGQAVIGLPVIAVTGVVFGADDVVVNARFEAQAETGHALLDDAGAADQGGRARFVDHDLGGAQHAFVFPFGVGNALFWRAWPR